MNLIQRLTIVAAFFSVLGLFAAVSYVLVHQEKRHLIKKLVSDDGTINRALFSSQDDVRSIMIGLIDAEKKRIQFAIYTLTDKAIAQAFIRAFKRGVVIEGVVDRSYGQSYSSTVKVLANAQIPLWVFQPVTKGQYEGLMHNKFCIFDSTLEGKALVWTGSYNFTTSASVRNEENVVILDSPKVYTAFTNYFAYLKNNSLQISGPSSDIVRQTSNKKKFGNILG